MGLFNNSKTLFCNSEFREHCKSQAPEAGDGSTSKNLLIFKFLTEVSEAVFFTVSVNEKIKNFYPL